jgi:hypothetical protein
MKDRTAPLQHWLEGDLGRLLVRHAGLLVGRSAECDVVLADARVSRHHLLLRPTDDGVEVTVLGRAPVQVNGAAVAASATLRDGDAIALLGKTFRVVSTAAPPARVESFVWGVEVREGAYYRVLESPFTLGGGPRDHLQMAQWPPALLTLTTVQRALVLEASQPGVTLDGAALQESQVAAVLPGAVARYLDQSIRFVAAPAASELETVPSEDESLPRLARLEFLTRGGRLTLGFGAWERTLWLADRRCDLVATLLFPPAPFTAGDAIPDEVLLPRVWPDGHAGRVELNTLVFRARKDLVRADIDGATLVDRGDGATRFRLRDGATATLVSKP